RETERIESWKWVFGERTGSSSSAGGVERSPVPGQVTTSIRCHSARSDVCAPQDLTPRPRPSCRRGRGQARHRKEVKHEADTDDPGDVSGGRLHAGTGGTSARSGASPRPATGGR